MNYTESEAREQFLKFLSENGFEVSDLSLVVNKEERCRVLGDKGKKKSGRYKLFLDNKANGWCINYLQGGEYIRWNYQFTEEERREWGRKKREQELAEGKVYNPETSEEERQKLKEKLEQERLEKEQAAKEWEEQYHQRKAEEEAKLALVFEEVCDSIEVELHRNTMECDSHPYLSKKGVLAHGSLMQIMVSYHIPDLLDEESEGQYMEEGCLVIPLYNAEGRLVTYQTINDDGSVKKFRLNGSKHAAFYVIGASSIEDLADLDDLLYAEGYATGASIYEFSGKPVICCFDVGNLAAVYHVLKELYADKHHIICSDNDYYKYKKKLSEGNEKAKNVGLTYALRLQEEDGATVVFPVFPKYHPASDWNDLVQGFDAATAKKQFDFQLQYMQEHGEAIYSNEGVMKELCAECFPE